MDLEPADFRIITGTEVLEEVSANRWACQRIVREGYLTHDVNDSVVPHSNFLRFPSQERDRIIALPAYLGGSFDVAGIKWISSFPGNTEHGIPRASATLLLNDCTTGYPFACLESSIISATRTAASAVLGAEALAGERAAGTIGFVGTGLIADHVRRFFVDLSWQIDGCRLYDTDRQAAQQFAETCGNEGFSDVRVVDSADEAITSSDVVILATVQGNPHIHDPSLFRHSPTVLHISLRDLAPPLIRDSFNITDDINHAVREHTSLHLTEQEEGHRRFVHGTIVDVLNGTLQPPSDQPAIFSPFGLGALDLAVGQWVYDQVVARGGGQRVPNFFPVP